MWYDHLFFPLNAPEVIAYSVARLVLGILFFFQAYDKIFRIGLGNVYLEVSRGAEDKGIPAGISKLSVYATSYIELIAGALLIFGLFTPVVLGVLGLHLVMVV